MGNQEQLHIELMLIWVSFHFPSSCKTNSHCKSLKTTIEETEAQEDFYSSISHVNDLFNPLLHIFIWLLLLYKHATLKYPWEAVP